MNFMKNLKKEIKLDNPIWLNLWMKKQHFLIKSKALSLFGIITLFFLSFAALINYKFTPFDTISTSINVLLSCFYLILNIAAIPLYKTVFSKHLMPSYILKYEVNEYAFNQIFNEKNFPQHYDNIFNVILSYILQQPEKNLINQTQKVLSLIIYNKTLLEACFFDELDVNTKTLVKNQEEDILKFLNIIVAKIDEKNLLKNNAFLDFLAIDLKEKLNLFNEFKKINVDLINFKTQEEKKVLEAKEKALNSIQDFVVKEKKHKKTLSL